MDRFITIQELADLTSLSVGTIKNKLSLAPHTLPRPLDLEASGQLRFRLSEVQDWMASIKHRVLTTPPTAKRPVGRPRKVEKMLHEMETA